MKIDLGAALQKAENSTWALRKLNLALAMGIPFNKPHGIKVAKVEPNAVSSIIPYKRKNFNHIKGVHACGLATVAEFCSGLVLLRKLDPRSYRIIMQKIEVTYHYQAKSDATARFELSQEDFESKILLPLKSEESVYHTCEIPVHDAKGNLLCTAKTIWQIKTWEKVKTKVGS